jgi:hypothetical protein
MLITPPLTITRFAQLTSGELFLSQFQETSFVALTVVDPDGDMLMVPLGPGFPDGLDRPSLVRSLGANVISFGKKYELRLPAQPNGWRLTPPDPATHCIAVTEEGAFVRANFAPPPTEYRPCYVDLDSGRIVTAGQGRGAAYAEPRGLKAFAVEWEIITHEEKPRRILAYPW